MVKKDEDGTTSGAKKIPLILKDFFSIKPVDNHISMTYNIKSHEDGLIFCLRATMLLHLLRVGESNYLLP
jgi:hypothetical protein